MAGYYSALASCYGCGGLMSFNPVKVPSLRVDGERQPICETCVGIVNSKRRAAGVPEFEIPEGAYAPAPEEELVYA